MATSPAPRTDLTRPAWTLAAKAKSGKKRCCAKCRRGVPGDGDLPCGYLGDCPNECHTNPTTEGADA